MRSKITIDGVDYVPRDSVISDNAMKLLNDIYASIWCEAVYDASSEQVEKFAVTLMKPLRALNDELGFKK